MSFEDTLRYLGGATRPKCGFDFSWQLLGNLRAPSGSLRWLQLRPRPRNAEQRWVLGAIRLWAEDYLYGGWQSKSRQELEKRKRLPRHTILGKLLPFS